MSPRLRLPWLSRAHEDAVAPTEPTAVDPALPALAASTAPAVAPAVNPAVNPGVDPAMAPAVVRTARTSRTGRIVTDAAPHTPPADSDPLAAGLALLAQYKRAVLSWVEEDGYPVNVDIEIEVKRDEGTVRFAEPAGFHIHPGSVVAITGSHIRALPESGFDQRRHVTVWGAILTRPRGRFAVTPTRVWAWDELDTPLPAAYERSLPKARRYFDALSAERGELVRPKLPRGLLLLRATRAPFLSATLVPVLLGLAVALRAGVFDPLTAAITLLAACAVHLGLNVANDVFDTVQGADDANRTPTKFSGGSRVIQNALVTIREMSILAIACYAIAGVLGLMLLVLRGSPALIVISAIGFVISVAYTMPPFKLVYRGWGEVSTAIGFGPVMLLGTYAVQSRGSLSAEAILASVPVALLVALILYVNEIPDRIGDSKAGKRTLPVRWSKAAVIGGFDVAAGGAFVSVVGGIAAGLLPIPTILVLLAVPTALQVHAGLDRFYDNPYGLMDTMAANIKLHAAVGALLLTGYVLAIADQAFLHLRAFFW